MTCVFCQIIAGALPASRVYEDESCLAFMDIHPLGRGHVLVIPKQHAIQLTDLPADQAQHLYAVGDRILRAQRALGWGSRGSHLLVNDGPAANQLVPHIHLHLIPRERGDTLGALGRLTLHLTGLMGFKTARQQLDNQADQLRQALAQLDSAAP